MSATAWTTGEATSKEILAASEYRDEYTVQLHDTDPVYLAFGETAVDATGIKLSFPGDSVRVRGAKARMSLNAVGAAASAGGIETMTGIEYRPGPNRFPAS